MTYTASQVAARFGMTKDGLRYYEKEGLLPPIARNKSGHRVYSEADIEWIFLVRCVREMDMPISSIRKYVSLLINEGGESILARREILKEYQDILAAKITNLQNLQKLIGKKLEFFDDALMAENPEAVRCMDYDGEWEQFKKFLGGDACE